MRMLELLKPQCEREQMQSSLAEVFVLQALLEYRKGQRMSAIRLLHEALSIGERNGYIRTFVDEGAQAAELLSDYLSMRGRKEPDPKWDGVSAAYVNQLVALFPHDMPQTSPKSYTLDAPLSQGELDLLRLLRNGATNKQIAAQLTLSVGTVRVYLSRLYEKLNVSTRTQALIAAQELNIIE
jgi:LuxR family maltose regulon positive regulatory protein